jgi:hypothetical protein
VVIYLGFNPVFVERGAGEGADAVENQDRRDVNLQVRAVF